tara:strand:- start:1855 stop:4026 length:2172 start_codon:yes stop_codon:yes gene_type:complete
MEQKTINPPAGTKKEVQEKLINKDLKTLKLVDLKKISKEIGIKGVSNLKKDSIIDLIEKSVSEKVTKKKSAAKKSPEKKTLAKKSTAKKSTAKKSPEKKSPEKKTPEKKTLAKKSPKKESSNTEQMITENYLLKYKKLNLEKINIKLEEVIESSNWFNKNREIQDLIKIFKEKINKESKKAEKKFFVENSDDKNFTYKSEFKIKFDKTIFEYRNKRKKYFKNLEITQNENLEKKHEIIENIKKLIDKNSGDFEGIYKEFKINKENWHNTGAVPRSKDQNLWQTFKHHVERFYDLLHLNRKFREVDYKHNYKEKLKVIENAELLTTEKDIIKATRNINILHKKWKNELGPVEKKHRESLWNRFQLATKEIQKNRKEFQKNAIKSIKENITYKEEVLKKMNLHLDQIPNNHSDWQKKLTSFQKLREEFKAIGYVPNKDGKFLWKKFRDHSKIFMNSKNEFYKNQKADYKYKISQKKDLINEMNYILNSDDWDEKLEKVKKNQIKWKSIGFIPRKIDNKLWKEFSNFNNLYFDRIKSGYNKLNKKEANFYNSKREFIDKIKNIKLSKDIDKSIKIIEEDLKEWIKLGELNNKINQKLNNEFSKSLIKIINNNKSVINIKEDLIFEVRLKLLEHQIENPNYIYESELNKEKNLVNELNQLENNLEFFTNSSSENKLFKDVEKKIKIIKSQIELIREKKKRIKSLKKVNEKMVKSDKDDKKENKSNKG